MSDLANGLIKGGLKQASRDANGDRILVRLRRCKICLSSSDSRTHGLIGDIQHTTQKEGDQQAQCLQEDI
jgi:hypothetical protein